MSFHVGPTLATIYGATNRGRIENFHDNFSKYQMSYNRERGRSQFGEDARHILANGMEDLARGLTSQACCSNSVVTISQRRHSLNLPKLDSDGEGISSRGTAAMGAVATVPLAVRTCFTRIAESCVPPLM
jgi:hypothetical protein